MEIHYWLLKYIFPPYLKATHSFLGYCNVLNAKKQAKTFTAMFFILKLHLPCYLQPILVKEVYLFWMGLEPDRGIFLKLVSTFLNDPLSFVFNFWRLDGDFLFSGEESLDARARASARNFGGHEEMISRMTVNVVKTAQRVIFIAGSSGML